MARFSRGLKAAVLYVAAAGTLKAGGCTTQEMAQMFGGSSSSPTSTATATASPSPANETAADRQKKTGATDHCKALGELQTRDPACR